MDLVAPLPQIGFSRVSCRQLWRSGVQDLWQMASYRIKHSADIPGDFPSLSSGLESLLIMSQLWFNVGVIILANAQALSQIASNKVCFTVLALIWTIVGMGVGQIRSLSRFSWLANGAVWLNLIVLAMTMGVVVHSVPNYAGALAQYGTDVVNMANIAPVTTSAFISGEVSSQIVGVMQIVYVSTVHF